MSVSPNGRSSRRGSLNIMTMEQDNLKRNTFIQMAVRLYTMEIPKGQL